MPKKNTNNKQSNAKEFISSYNNIDHSLRIQHGLKRSMGFSDMIRRAVQFNYIVRKYEEDLIDYGRLRNAIIHRSNEDFVIAEPHDDIVSKIKIIETLITTPPKAMEMISQKDVLSVDASVSVRKTIQLIAESKFSNIPVYKNGELVGVANGQKILDAFGKHLITGKSADEFLNNKTIEDIIMLPIEINYYKVFSEEVTIEEILREFQINRKLLCVIVTKSGSMHDVPIGIITTSDVMHMNEVMENYN
ncbi:MAG: CBS domain-containing protein [Clostridia bacterium]